MKQALVEVGSLGWAWRGPTFPKNNVNYLYKCMCVWESRVRSFDVSFKAVRPGPERISRGPHLVPLVKRPFHAWPSCACWGSPSGWTYWCSKDTWRAYCQHGGACGPVGCTFCWKTCHIPEKNEQRIIQNSDIYEQRHKQKRSMSELLVDGRSW